MEERALRPVERNHAEGLCRGMGFQKVHDDAHLAIVEKRGKSSRSTATRLFGSGVVDEHESRERGEDERKRFRGRSVEKRGVIEERGGEIGDAGMAAILRV